MTSLRHLSLEFPEQVHHPRHRPAELKFSASPSPVAPRKVVAPNDTPLRVLLLEDSEADAELITHELMESGMTIMTGRADSAEAFADALTSFEPDVVISDDSLGQFDSLAALKMVRAKRPTVPFIIVAGALTGGQSVAAVRAGADDLVLKGYLSRLPAAVAEALAIRRPLQKLTARQIEVLMMVAEGHRTREIATRLRLSVKTIESHRGEIMKRLDVHDVVSLARYAIRVGLVPSRL
jgi:DNA-binding NarL/FixJ family response regulator